MKFLSIIFVFCIVALTLEPAAATVYYNHSGSQAKVCLESCCAAAAKEKNKKMPAANCCNNPFMNCSNSCACFIFAETHDDIIIKVSQDHPVFNEDVFSAYCGNCFHPPNFISRLKNDVEEFQLLKTKNYIV